MAEEKDMYRKKISFQTKRFLKFLRIFARSKKGVVGLAIILFFTFISIFPQLFTPYNSRGEDPRHPNIPVGARLSAPEWLRYLPTFLGGRPGLSSTMWVVNQPGRPQLTDSGGEWNITAPEDLLNEKLFIKLNETVNYPYSNMPGSLEVTFKRESTADPCGRIELTIYKEFYWPYEEKPGRFIGFVAVLASGTTYLDEKNRTYLQVPIDVDVFLEQVETQKYYELWPPVIRVNRGYRWDQVSYGLWPTTGFYVNETIKDIIDRSRINPYAILELNNYPSAEMDVYIRQPEAGTVQNGWLIAASSPDTNITAIDSLASGLNQRTDLFPPAGMPLQAFSKCPGTYRYGVKIVLRDETFINQTVQSTLFIDQLDFGMWGSAFGLMGTDDKGRDLFAQLIYGARASLYVGLLSTFLGIGIGLIVGLAAGYVGKAVDEVLMRFADMLLVLPSLPLLIVLVAILGASLENLIILLGFLGWMGFSRLIRSQVLSLRERPFVEAAKAIGAGKLHILSQHILPNVMGLVYVSLATSVPGSIVAEAALSWLGFVDPYRMSWGKMLYECQFVASAISNWWWVIPPGLCIAALALAFIFLGFAIDDILNPKLRVRR